MLSRNPNQSYASILEELKLKWRTASDEERNVFVKKASVEKSRFARELLEWNRRQDVFLREKGESERQARLEADPVSSST